MKQHVFRYDKHHRADDIVFNLGISFWTQRRNNPTIISTVQGEAFLSIFHVDVIYRNVIVYNVHIFLYCAQFFEIFYEIKLYIKHILHLLPPDPNFLYYIVRMEVSHVATLATYTWKKNLFLLIKSWKVKL